MIPPIAYTPGFFTRLIFIDRTQTDYMIKVYTSDSKTLKKLMGTRAPEPPYSIILSWIRLNDARL